MPDLTLPPSTPTTVEHGRCATREVWTVARRAVVEGLFTAMRRWEGFIRDRYGAGEPRGTMRRPDGRCQRPFKDVRRNYTDMRYFWRY